VCLQSTADESGDGRYADDRAAGGCLGGHLTSGGLGGVEGAIEVGADCVRVEIGFYAVITVNKLIDTGDKA